MNKLKKHVQLKQNLDGLKSVDKFISSLIQYQYGESFGSVKLIAIGGPGGIGKTTFSKKLAKRLNNAAILHLDDYKTARKLRKKNGLYGSHPDANKMDLIFKHLCQIKSKQAIQKPIYNSVTGDAENSETFVPARYNIIEGEISTYSHFREQMDLTIFIDSHWKTQLKTRLTRDVEVRKYSREKAIATFLHSNIYEFQEFGVKSKASSDIHLFCQDDYKLRVEAISDHLLNAYELCMA